MAKRPIRILLVEDHRPDVTLTRRAFRRLKTEVDIQVVYDGFEAMSFLQKRGRYTEALQPDLILLDLNMPRMGGHEVLMAMSQDPVLRAIPVVVLTTSGSADDVGKSYQNGCNSYLVKPVRFDEFMRTVEIIEEYWLSLSRIPEH